MSRFAPMTAAMLKHNIRQETSATTSTAAAGGGGVKLRPNPITQDDDSFDPEAAMMGATGDQRRMGIAGGKRRNDLMTFRKTNPYGEEEITGPVLTASQLSKLEASSSTPKSTNSSNGQTNSASVASSMGYSHRAQLPLPLGHRSTSSAGSTSGVAPWTQLGVPSSASRRSSSNADSRSDYGSQMSSASAFELECKIKALEKALESETLQRETAEAALVDIHLSVKKQNEKLLISPAQQKRAGKDGGKDKAGPLGERSLNLGLCGQSSKKEQSPTPAFDRPPLAPIRRSPSSSTSSAVGRLLLATSKEMASAQKTQSKKKKQVHFKSPSPARSLSSAGSVVGRSPNCSGSLGSLIRPASSLH